MTFITENQFPLLMVFFLAGVVCTALIFRKPAGHRALLMVDLNRLVLGGFGALVAVLAGIYKTDSGRIDRQIDISCAAASAFDKDAARFRLTYFEGPDGADISTS